MQPAGRKLNMLDLHSFRNLPFLRYKAWLSFYYSSFFVLERQEGSYFKALKS